MSISAQLVKQLREKTGAGMMDCKKALSETEGDMEAAVDWLRKKGLSKAANKADRIAAEGLIGVSSDPSGKRAVVVEVNSETDFVARNEQFQNLVRSIAEAALEAGGDRDALLETPLRSTGRTVSGELTEAIATIGENMALRRVGLMEVSDGVVSTYVHGGVAEGLGRIGVLVGLESAGDAEKLNELGRKIAMHVAATSPLAATADEIHSSVVERERAVYADQARQSGKPAAIIEKMVEGRLRKFYEEVALVHQAFVVDPDKTVSEAVEQLAKELGTPVRLVGFVRFALGEGIERGDGPDFAAEVAAAAGH